MSDPLFWLALCRFGVGLTVLQHVLRVSIWSAAPFYVLGVIAGVVVSHWAFA